MPFNRNVYFENVRSSLFGGKLTQEQVDGQNFILSAWEQTRERLGQELRWLAYELATTKHETASTMMPIEEYGKGNGMEYGLPHPATGQTYYGRGFVQLTWYDNYLKMTPVCQDACKNWDLDLTLKPELALDPFNAAIIMFDGMEKGSFRSGHNLDRYFNDFENNPFEARDIINGDKHYIPSWSNGKSIGNLIADYYDKFLKALELAFSEINEPIEPVEPIEPDSVDKELIVEIYAPEGVAIRVIRV